MEKFGIFELLDTLSALIAADRAHTQETERTSPDPNDASFAPPAYGAPAKTEEDGGNSALSSFLKKHDAAARRLDGKK